ncbi:MAG: DUF4270 family protein [Bacteroidales bacterium]|jgi:hypothetical protein|nr:DUF4270 family protein [Bacteroidales bacterium]
MIKLSDRTASASKAIQRTLRKHIHNILTLLTAMAFFIVSCEEDPSTIGDGILPDVDFDSIVGVDTMDVGMYTFFNESATSITPSISYLGTLVDPYFGATSSDFVTQLWLATAWPGFGLASVDSVRMYLQVNNVIGEMPEESFLHIGELSERLSADSSYQVNGDVPLKDFMGDYRLATLTIPALEEGADSLIKIDMPLSFGNYLMRDTSKLFLGTDTIDFRDYLYGLYFEYPQSGSYHMLVVDIYSDNTSIVVYYTDASGESRFYEFLINQRCVNYNRYLHDYDQADPEKRIKYINEPIKDTLAYIQSMEGVFTKMIIPGLENLRPLAGNIAVNKARLYLPVYLNDEDYTEDMVPENILVRYDSAGVKRLLPDYFIGSNGAFLDGTYSKITNLYELNISNFVQEYIEGKIVDPVIEIFLQSLGTKNLILKANRDSDDAVRFELTYTVLNEE